MHKFRTILSVVATAAMVLGTMGVASAAGASNETRADFIVQLDQSLGIQPVTPSTPDFSDVPSTNADYGYIEAAYQKGFINGIAKGLFGPTLPITRAEAAKILVEAYEGGNYTPTQTSTTFTDNASIPTALVGYVAEANSLKLMLGFTSGSFGPEAYLTTAQETHLIAQLQAVQAAAGFKVTASATDVAVGQLVTLSSTGAGTTTYAVTGANAAQALISGNTFVASTAGNYTVTGTNGGNTASVTIGVYGAAAALKISAPKTVVANDASQTNVTVSVVDANGNVVANNTDNISLESSNASAGGVSVSTSANPVAANTNVTVAAVNGVATFTLTSGNVPGATTTLTATDPTEPSALNASSYTATVSTTAQEATALSVSPESSYVSVNTGNNPAVFDVQVVDQTGNAMLYGTYPFTATISGPAEFTDGTTTAHSYAYTGDNSASQVATVTVDALQGQTGAITLNVTGTNLTSATGSVTAVISGAATGLQLTAPSTTSVSQDLLEATSSSYSANALEYSVSAVDANGHPVASGGPATAKVTITNSSGTNVTSEFLANSTVSVGGTFSIHSLNTDVTSGFSADAGTYTVQVAQPGYTSSAADQFTITAGTPTQLSVTGASVIAASNPTDAISAQVEDAWGNDASIAGIPVTFASSNTNVTLSASTAYTNASGVATVTASVPAYVATSTPQYTVTAQGEYNAASANLPTSGPVSFGFSVESTVATSVSVTLETIAAGLLYNGSNGIAQAGEEVQATVYANDQYGNNVATGDTIDIAFGGTGAVASSSANALAGTTESSTSATLAKLAPLSAVIDFWATGSGSVSVTATDASAPGSPKTTAALSVVPGDISNFALLDSSNNNATNGETVTADTPLALTLSGVDAYGNSSYQPGSTTVSGNTYTYNGYVVALPVVATGSFRSTSSGATEEAIVVPAGSTSVPVYYVDSTSETVDLTPAYFLGYVNAQNGANSVTFTPSVTGSLTGTGVSGDTLSWTAGTSGTATLTFAPTTGSAITFQFNY